MIRPGDQVYVAHAGYAEYQTVTKVGHKWAETNHLRFHRDTLLIDGRGTGLGSTGQVWRSLEHWEQHEAAKRAWSQLKTFIERHWTPPNHLDKEKIQGIIDLLEGK